MTLVVAVTGEKSIWMSTDRRLSFRHRKPRNDARKFLVLETTDGVAMLGYAGLGSTVLGTEPSDWMARVLRGRNLPLEQSLAVLAGAVRVKLPRHLESLPGSGPPAHNIIIPALLNGEPRLYSIDLVRSPRRSEYSFRYTRHVIGRQLPRGHQTPRIGVGGSGKVHLQRDQRWARELLRMVTAHDAGRISAQAVACAFAQLNHRVARAEKTVGQRCIVAWRSKATGGGQELFAGTQKEVSSSPARLPIIACGLDIDAIMQTMRPFALDIFDAIDRGETREIDGDAINTEFAKLPAGPDDNLA
jgi:hypothetical protein